MSSLLRIVLLTVATALAVGGLDQARRSITVEEVRAHLFLLSSDRLAGRAPGTRGAAIAADYIESRFMATGLEPVNGSYRQAVPMVGITPDSSTLSLGFERGGRRLPARYPRDAVIWPGAPEPEIEVAAELVFVGYGIDAPEWSWSDYEGRDLSGKVLLFLLGEPPAPPDEPELFDGRALTYFGRWSYKLEEARRQGAAGALIIHRPETAGYGWGVVVTSWAGERLSLVDEAVDRPPADVQGWLTERFARELLEAAGLDLDELAVQAARRDFRPVPTGLTAQARVESRSRRVQAHNVVGWLPGTDSVDQEVVVLTSHYDHLGVGPPVAGDSIYNGAYDNASGVALLLEVADAFSRVERPRRSVVFIATTGEEDGLLGSSHYVRRPLFPLHRTVAALNVDGANLWGPTRDVFGLGAELSSLGRLLQDEAADMELRVRYDPLPERGGFFRSDHFPFARAGIPALSLQHGLDFDGRPPGWGNLLMDRWLREHYHMPSDELPPDTDLRGAVQQGRLLLSLAYRAAEAEERPRWNQGVPFDGAGPPAP